MSVWVAPVALIGVVGVAVMGRTGDPASAPRPSAPTIVVAAASSVASANVPPAPRPSRRSDWPGAIGRPGGSVPPVQQPTHRQREEGTDGLMGSLPFGIPGDTPYRARDLVNRFTIDDILIAE